MRKSGYVFTISTFLLLSSVILLATFFASDVRPVDTSGPKLSMLYDDIRGDIVDLFNISVSVETDNNMTTVEFNDMVPSLAWQHLENYKAYVERNYTGHVGGNIDNREGSLAGADAVLNLTNYTLIIWPHNYTYTYNNLSKNLILISPAQNHSKLMGFGVNLTMDRNITRMNSSISDGNLSSLVFAAYNNHNFSMSAEVSYNESSWWRVETIGGNITITAGRFLSGIYNLTDAVVIRMDGNVSAAIRTDLLFNQTSPVIVDSGFAVELRDISREAFINDHIWFLRE